MDIGTGASVTHNGWEFTMKVRDGVVVFQRYNSCASVETDGHIFSNWQPGDSKANSRIVENAAREFAKTFKRMGQST